MIENVDPVNVKVRKYLAEIIITTIRTGNGTRLYPIQFL